jgi:hypothetical protein
VAQRLVNTAKNRSNIANEPNAVKQIARFSLKRTVWGEQAAKHTYPESKNLPRLGKKRENPRPAARMSIKKPQFLPRNAWPIQPDGS